MIYSTIKINPLISRGVNGFAILCILYLKLDGDTMMKIVVNFIQIILIMGMLYPVYAMWNNDRISRFCVDLKANMTKQSLLDLAEQKNIKVSLEHINDLKWRTTASLSANFSNYSCQIRGLGDRVASSKIVTK